MAHHLFKPGYAAASLLSWSVSEYDSPATCDSPQSIGVGCSSFSVSSPDSVDLGSKEQAAPDESRHVRSVPHEDLPEVLGTRICKTDFMELSISHEVVIQPGKTDFIFVEDLFTGRCGVDCLLAVHPLAEEGI